MKELLEEIQTIPGIIGGFFFSSRSGVEASSLPAVFKERKLLNIGKMLAKIYGSGRINFPDISEITLYYEESLVIAREIGDSVFLIILCDASLNLNLLTMTLNLIVEDLPRIRADRASQEPVAAEIPSRPSAEPGKKNGLPRNARQLMESSAISEQLDAMKKQLSKIMGPMSQIIFMDALEEWVAQEAPSASGLSSLVRILNREIDDPDKAGRYEKLVNPYLNN
jgi:predicted regulator of Ras-like GTPase activity (Roadblock/LC7/MglB family)